ncbi:type III-B CRISPR-associated protein Cas10/Cmr2 [Crocosphaera sp. XPORK-15E]|uniref:type III-B CRISPR-associated protein Cas10/Cmr2 n=1 Tax=Crocosphaera sp. XPORK-15E TaxID=3110247 RepID=UPI002B21B25C|nr:type III-B CRISPR-associated protein Cas10/Cmr2 [Crocosphaera sp. XPORK-15E]MEA5537018.1 type III-B CRISPR-associated protein Cas10/Cmr2 [Crocosphaera sp. XPORK-15E]
MSHPYWQAKIWGLLHDPALKALHDNSGRGGNSFWRELPIMQEWVANDLNPEKSGKKIFKQIKLADYITSASDRGAIGSLTNSVNYSDNGLEISHLLSGEKLNFKIKQHDTMLSKGQRLQFLEGKEQELLKLIPSNLIELIPSDPEKDKQDYEKALFWWLWRCLPEATCQLFDNDASLLLMPAETRLPDSSIWSHASLTAAMAGALAGYDLTTEDITKNWKANKPLSHPYLASFTFSPIQELIKASRKMRDFWAGSWILHYLSAKVSWTLANIYGPDCLIYPNLYQQPLIDHWLLQKYSRFGFNQWIKQPSDRSLLTAGFPNVIVLVLPKDKVQAAMQTAKSTLINEWLNISQLVFTELEDRHWMKGLSFDHKNWKGWLKSQWQTYWTAVPIGVDKEQENKQGKLEKIELTSSEIYRDNDSNQRENKETEATDIKEKDQHWVETQNQGYGLNEKNALFLKQELNFLQKAGNIRREKQNRHPFNANVGSWWAAIFDQTRLALTAVKNGRDWQIPTAFSTRSTISGLGAVVHPINDWIEEGKTKALWKRQAGLFDGIEQLNATETVKRGLHLVLPKLLNLEEEKITITYPDLTCGVAGYLKTGNPEDLEHFEATSQAVIKEYLEEHNKIPDEITDKWGIPWSDDNQNIKYHPRLLNSGWLVEDLEKESTPENRAKLQQLIRHYYPNNNPTNWYVIAAGDGDGMSEWLKGTKLKSYGEYTSKNLEVTGDIKEDFNEFLKSPKRMGPSTHNALSRALLDFSNQLVPYLTEERYAGRLIYSGGDDVLAYTNLWEWDNWLWDIRQCFRGDKDPIGFDNDGNFTVEKSEFKNEGDYWQWNQENRPKNLAERPLFTMGRNATISFGMVMAHHSVPLAISLENLWEAEEEAKEHYINKNNHQTYKNAVQVRVIYGNGNILKATTKFEVFEQWKNLIELDNIESSLFEQAANLWTQHPSPMKEAIHPWIIAFCHRREKLNDDISKSFETALSKFLYYLWENTPEEQLNQEVQSWLRLAAFVKRNRQIQLGGKA